MNKKNRVPILAAAVLVLAAAMVLVLTRPWDRTIRIKTALSPQETLSRVELTAGALHFKTEQERDKELTSEDMKAYAPRPAPEYSTDTEVFNLREEDVLRMLNIDPEKWSIPERFSFQFEHFRWAIGLSSAEAPETDEGHTLYVREYRTEDQNVILHMEAALAGKCWLRTEAELTAGERLEHVKLRYGELDSRIGNMPLSVLNRGRYYDAYLIKGNTAWFIQSNGMTQQEFTELLISIYEAPETETGDPVAFLRSLKTEN